MIPYNLYGMAASVIGTQTVDYYRYTGRAVQSNGRYETTYAEAEPIKCQFQSVERSRYANMGLDFAKSYRTLFTDHDLNDVQEGRPGDQVVYFGRRYEAVGKTDWTNQNGWNGVVFVDIGAAND